MALLVGLPVAGLVLLLPGDLPLLVPALRLVDGLAGGRVVHPDLAPLAVLLPVLLAYMGRFIFTDLLVFGVVDSAIVVFALLMPLLFALLLVSGDAELVDISGVTFGVVLLAVFDVFDDLAVG